MSKAIYQNSAWRKSSLAFRADNPLCAQCLANGLVAAARCVDHIEPHRGNLDLFWDPTNWQSLCKQCHNAKSQGERFDSCSYDWQPRIGRHVVWGPPGAGKTTYVATNAKPEDLIWDWDMVCREMGLPKGMHVSVLIARAEWIQRAKHSAKRCWFICTSEQVAYRTGRYLEAMMTALTPVRWTDKRAKMEDMVCAGKMA